MGSGFQEMVSARGLLAPLLRRPEEQKRKNKEEKKHSLYKTEEIYSSGKSVSNALASGTLTLVQWPERRQQEPTSLFRVFCYARVSVQFISQKKVTSSSEIKYFKCTDTSRKSA